MLPGGRSRPRLREARGVGASARPRFSPRTRGVRVARPSAQLREPVGRDVGGDRHGRGAPAGFHHVSSVELPLKRSVGGPCPPDPRVRTKRAKISLTLPREPM